MIWGAIVAAAGRGTRLGRPKQFIEIAGLPMVAWSLQTFIGMPEIAELVVVTESEWVDELQAMLEDLAPPCSASVVAGGATRQQSVRNGFDALTTRCEAVLVHDGARPLVQARDVRAGMAAVRDGRAAVLAAPVVDTIKVVDSAAMLVEQTLDRERLWAAQTPQFAMLRDFLRAHVHADEAAFAATDDAALLERVGVEVMVVPSSAANFKVTLPEDVAQAEKLLRERVAAS